MSKPSSRNHSEATNKYQYGKQTSVQPIREPELVFKKIRGDIIPGSVYSDGESKWNLVLDTKVLRIFMSSTFRDMQKERDEFFAIAEKK
jgi:hypothetical protein